MTIPISGSGDDDEWNLDNLPSRGRSESVSEWDMPTRGRAVAVDYGHLAAANNQNRLGVVWLFSKIYVDEKPVWMNRILSPTPRFRARSVAVLMSAGSISTPTPRAPYFRAAEITMRPSPQPRS